MSQFGNRRDTGENRSEKAALPKERATRPEAKRAKVTLSVREKDDPASSKSCKMSQRKAKLFRKKILMNKVRNTDVTAVRSMASNLASFEWWIEMKRDANLAEIVGVGLQGNRFYTE